MSKSLRSVLTMALIALSVASYCQKPPANPPKNPKPPAPPIVSQTKAPIAKPLSTLLTLSLNPTSVVGGKSSVGQITVDSAAPAGGVTVTLSTDNGSTIVPASATIASGTKAANFTITTLGVASKVTATISATLAGVTKTATLDVLPANLSRLYITPTSVTGGESAVGTAGLDGVAPPAGVTISLSSDSPSMTVPSSVKIAAGNLTADFPITTKAGSTQINATITAKLGATTVTATIGIGSPNLQSVSVSPAASVGGWSTPQTGTVWLTSASPPGGMPVTVSSSAPAVAPVPATVKVPAGAMSETFSIALKQVKTRQVVTITGTIDNKSKSIDLVVGPFMVRSISFVPASLSGGAKSVGTLKLNAEPGATNGPVSVKLASNSPYATVPASVSVPVGTSYITFSITTKVTAANQVARITATLNGTSVYGDLTVTPPLVSTFTLTPATVKGSASTVVTGKVTLTGVAPTGGTVVALSSGDTSIANVPASVTVPAGKTSVTFKVAHSKVINQSQVILSAQTGTTVSQVTLTVNP